jgi:transposase
MRGTDDRHDGLFSYVRPDSRTTKGHPLRVIRRITDAALASLSARFDALYANEGRPSIPPEQLLRALLLQAFHAIRSERQRKGRTFHTEGEQQKNLRSAILYV